MPRTPVLQLLPDWCLCFSQISPSTRITLYFILFCVNLKMQVSLKELREESHMPRETLMRSVRALENLDIIRPVVTKNNHRTFALRALRLQELGAPCVKEFFYGYQIEERLGFTHYTIHIEHHQALMAGYAQIKPQQFNPTDRPSSGTTEYRRWYYKQNRERLLERKRQVRATPEGKERQKRYYEANKEKLLQKSREYQKIHREELNAYHREYYAKKLAKRKKETNNH